MKALVKDRRAEGCSYINRPTPAPQADQVLIKVKAAALCRSDVDVYEWTELVQKGGVDLPIIMGHEFSGEVVGLGPDVKRLKIGDRVSAETHIPCGHCHTCRTDNQHICRNGMGVLGRTYDGCFAEYIVVPESVTVKMSDNLTWSQGALLEPMAVAMHAISKLPVGGNPIGVLGVGTIGQMAVQLLDVLGASKIIAVDVSDEKLASAKKLGASVTVNGMKADWVDIVNRETGGIGLAGVAELTGNERVINQAVEALRVAGRMVHVGMVEKPLTYNNFMYGLVYKELVVTGIFGRRMFETWETLLSILETGKIDLDAYVGLEVPFSQYQKGFDAFYETNGRVVFLMD